MAGIYIHIPFCKQACFYCNFYFSTSLKKKDELISCLIKEIEIRKSELKNEIVETIYFGGGTPSILSTEEIQRLIDVVYQNFEVFDNGDYEDLSGKYLNIKKYEEIQFKHRHYLE